MHNLFEYDVINKWPNFSEHNNFLLILWIIHVQHLTCMAVTPCWVHILPAIFVLLAVLSAVHPHTYGYHSTTVYHLFPLIPFTLDIQYVLSFPDLICCVHHFQNNAPISNPHQKLNLHMGPSEAFPLSCYNFASDKNLGRSWERDYIL